MDYAVIARHAASSQNWNKEGVNALLMVSDRAVTRALTKLHGFQTSLEQTTRCTRAHNGKGFTACDAGFLSSLAERVKRGQTLTPQQLGAVRRPNAKGHCRLAKYWRQLLGHTPTTSNKD